MSPVIQRTLATIAAIVTLAALTAVAQSPGRWLTQPKFAPVPVPEEEYWNAIVAGSLRRSHHAEAQIRR